MKKEAFYLIQAYNEQGAVRAAYIKFARKRQRKNKVKLAIYATLLFSVLLTFNLISLYTWGCLLSSFYVFLIYKEVKLALDEDALVTHMEKLGVSFYEQEEGYN